MSRRLRIVLLSGSCLLGLLHLPSATRAFAEGLASPRAVRAMDRVGAAAIDLEVRSPREERLARRDDVELGATSRER